MFADSIIFLPLSQLKARFKLHVPVVLSSHCVDATGVTPARHRHSMYYTIDCSRQLTHVTQKSRRDVDTYVCMNNIYSNDRVRPEASHRLLLPAERLPEGFILQLSAMRQKGKGLRRHPLAPPVVENPGPIGRLLSLRAWFLLAAVRLEKKPSSPASSEGGLSQRGTLCQSWGLFYCIGLFVVQYFQQIIPVEMAGKVVLKTRAKLILQTATPPKSGLD